MNPLMQLRDHGQSYWLDDLTRQMIASGDLAQRIGSEDLPGVTSNPAIFAKALQHGDGYTREIADAAVHGETPQQIYEELLDRGDARRRARNLDKEVWPLSTRRENRRASSRDVRCSPKASTSISPSWSRLRATRRSRTHTCACPSTETRTENPSRGSPRLQASSCAASTCSSMNTETSDLDVLVDPRCVQKRTRHKSMFVVAALIYDIY
jgi:hypothetical protein